MFDMKRISKLFLFFISMLTVFSCRQHSKEKNSLVKPVDTIARKNHTVSYFLNFRLDSVRLEPDTIQPGETFSKLLYRHHFSSKEIYNLVQRIDTLFDVKKLRAGKPYYFIYNVRDTSVRPKVFVVKNSESDFDIIHLDTLPEKPPVEHFVKPVKIIEKSVGVPINNSLFLDLKKRNISPVLALKLADIYAWTVDFFHLQKNDWFKAIYEDTYVDSVYTGVGTIKAAVFRHYGDTIYAFRYEFDTLNRLYDYFDEKGRSLRKQFLKSPLKFGRITSRYSMHRYVRIYHRIKPHLGTDFAAPVGTPIHATADGVVTKAAYTRGNGNYVKIRHNSTYSTQYLHMSRFAKGIRPGVRVHQGQVIGYVGMTGFTTGPHVCYRFWKNGRQVDPFKQKLPQAKSLKPEQMERYLEFIRPLKEKLDSIQVK